MGEGDSMAFNDEEQEGDPSQDGAEEWGPSQDEADNKIVVLDFPYDANNTNTFSTTTIIVEEDITSLTVCFAFMVDALKSAKEDKIQLLQLHDGDGNSLAELIFSVQFNETTFYGTSFTFESSGQSAHFEQPPFSLLTWIRVCLSLTNGTNGRNGIVTMTINGVAQENDLHSWDDQDNDLHGYIAGKGNFTLHIGKNLTGAVTQVNIFSPASDMEICIQ